MPVLHETERFCLRLAYGESLCGKPRLTKQTAICFYIKLTFGLFSVSTAIFLYKLKEARADLISVFYFIRFSRRFHDVDVC